MQWHQLDHMQTICTSLQTDNHTNTLNFYTLGPMSANSANQPMLPMHKQQCQSTEGTTVNTAAIIYAV